MRSPSPQELRSIRQVVHEVLLSASEVEPLTSPHQAIIAHYVGELPTPGTPWPCMDAVLVICDHTEAVALINAIAEAVRDLGGTAERVA